MYYVNISQRYELILTKIHWQLEICVCLCLIFTYANIVQMVKMCYKIKIDSRDSKKLFLWGFAVQTAPELNNSATFTVQ